MRRLILCIFAVSASLLASAQNPIISTLYTPDPAPFVHDGKVYLFADHDEDDATYFLMKDWLLYSTEDMVNWMIESFCEDTGVSLSNFAIYGDTNATPPRYVLLLEPEQPVPNDKIPEYEKLLEEKLEYVNMIYADYIESNTLAPLKLYISKKGSHAEYTRFKLKGGGLEHQTKPVHVLDTQDKREFFLARVENP